MTPVSHQVCLTFCVPPNGVSHVEKGHYMETSYTLILTVTEVDKVLSSLTANMCSSLNNRSIFPSN